MSDLIDRQRMINELDLHFGILYDSPTLLESLKTLVKAIPSAQPTLYGYSIESLAAVAETMKKGGMSPEEALWTYKNNVQRIAELIRAEWYENVQKQLEQMVFSGRQEE